MEKKIKVLFITKKKKSSGPGPYGQTISSGLLNSATFMNNMLVKNGIESNIVEVVDNNGIDKEVHDYKPTHVIIEALWVVPSKFEILTKLHPKVKWIIRLHSEVPFLANEGIATQWIFEYQKFDNVIVSVNSPRIEEELNVVLPKPVLYLPNFYPVNFSENKSASEKESDIINIGCFGAVRPMKNHLMQAIAAIKFADDMGYKLRLHINVTRVENNGDPVLKNIRNLFLNSTHELVEHTWLKHEEFVQLIKSMDMCLQVSFSETFNIVTADAVNMNVPVVVSPEVSWVAGLFKANPTNFKSIVRKMKLTWLFKPLYLQFLNKVLLYFYSNKSETIWLDYFIQESLCCICGCDCNTDCGCDCDCNCGCK